VARQPAEPIERDHRYRAIFSFYASARSLLGDNAVVVGVRIAAFTLILAGAALIPAPVRAGEVLHEATVQADIRPNSA
jgi:hypothetical protein